MKVNLDTGKRREDARKAIREKYGKLMAAVAAPYGQEERETWFTQLKEADEWLADNSADVPFITALAAARGIPLADLVGKIKENDNLFRQAVGRILGEQQRELDMLR